MCLIRIARLFRFRIDRLTLEMLSHVLPMFSPHQSCLFARPEGTGTLSFRLNKFLEVGRDLHTSICDRAEVWGNQVRGLTKGRARVIASAVFVFSAQGVTHLWGGCQLFRLGTSNPYFFFLVFLSGEFPLSSGAFAAIFPQAPGHFLRKLRTKRNKTPMSRSSMALAGAAGRDPGADVFLGAGAGGRGTVGFWRPHLPLGRR